MKNYVYGVTKMGKRDDKIKYKKNKKSTAMLVTIIAVIVLLVLFIILGSTLGGWIKALKDKSTQESSSSAISSSSVDSTPNSDADSTSTSNNNSDSSTDSEDNGYPKNETQLTSDYQLSAPKKGDTIATVTTSMGTLKFKLFPENAPLAVENFTKKAAAGYYNNTKFSVLYTDQAIQSQGDDKTVHGGTTFDNEFSVNLHNFYGALGCCNTGEANTNTNQFYIVTANKTPNDIIEAMSSERAQSMGLGFSPEIINKFKEFGGDPTLDGIFPVFGQLYEGFDILAKINAVPVDETTNAPKNDIQIISVTTEKY